MVGGPGTRERLLSELQEASAGGSRTMFGVGFSLLLLLSIFALSASQATERGPATNVLKSGIASVTEIDTLLAEHLPELRQSVATGNSETVGVPGYPLSVSLTRQEAANASQAEIRELLLSRSADLVYAKGLTAFDSNGTQSLGFLSSQGALKLGVGQLSEDSHDRAHLLTLIFGGIAALLAIGVLLANNGLGRMRAFALALLGGGVPAVILSILVKLVTDGLSGRDAYSAELGRIADAMVAVPLRNGLIVTLLGAFLLVAAIVLQLLASRLGFDRHDGFNQGVRQDLNQALNQGREDDPQWGYDPNYEIGGPD